MRLTIVYTLAVAVLQAQAPLTGEAALNRFKQQLEKLARVTQEPPAKVCAIPLLRVPVKPNVDPHMAIAPRSDVRFTVVEVIPPAPVCDEGNVSLKR
jgi:hypothetical protein